MSKKPSNWFLAALLFSISAEQVIAQGVIDGFTRGTGNTDIAIAFTQERADQFFPAGQRTRTPPPLGTITVSSDSLFIAHGLTDRVDLVFSLPYIRNEARGAGPEGQSDLQDLSLFIKWKPWSRQHGRVTSSFVTAGGFAMPAGDYEPDTPLAIGHRSSDLHARVLLHAVDRSGFFGHAGTGYAAKRGDPPDALSVFMKVGWSGSVLYLDAWLDRHDSLGGTDIGEAPFPTNEVDYIRLGGTIFVRFSKTFGLSLSGYDTIDGRNVNDFRAASAAVVYRLGR